MVFFNLVKRNFESRSEILQREATKLTIPRDELDKIRDKDRDNAFQGMRMGWDFLLRETRSARISM